MGTDFPEFDSQMNSVRSSTEDAVRATLVVQAFMFIAGLIGFIAGAWFVWENAPVVGGEWWPYVHAFVTLICAILVAKVAALIAFFISGFGGLVWVIVKFFR